MANGKSASNENPYGVRRVASEKVLAPKSLRKKGKKFASDCSDSCIADALGFDVSKMEEIEFVRSLGM